MNNPVEIAVGGSAAVQSLRGASATRQSHVNGVIASPERSHGRGNPGEVQVASLFMLPGMLAGLTNSAIADSNGEHLYYYHSDHLGTPLFLTDTDGVVVWRGEYLPFGEVFTEDKDPDGDGVEVTQPFRFPGQYADQETGLYYNYFRDYDPGIGRYVEFVGKPTQDEPNLYLYVNASPINYVDPLGLFRVEDLSPRARAILSLGASKLAQYAADRMEPCKARGAVFLVSAGLATYATAEAGIVAAGSWVVMTGGFATGNVPVAIGGGLMFGASASVAAYDLRLSAQLYYYAVGDFLGEDRVCKNQQDPCQ